MRPKTFVKTLFIAIISLLASSQAMAYSHISASQCDGFWRAQTSSSYNPNYRYANTDCAILMLSKMGIKHDDTTIDQIEQLYTKASNTVKDINSDIDIAAEDINLCDSPEFTCSLTKTQPTVQYKCTGDNSTGGWSTITTAQSACWAELTICNWSPANTTPPTEACVTMRPNQLTALKNFSTNTFYNQHQAPFHETPQATVIPAPFQNNSNYTAKFSKCGHENNMGTHRADIHKEYCIWEGSNYTHQVGNKTYYVPTEGRFKNDTNSDFSGMGQAVNMTGQTGDDMFALGRGADVFFEYIDISNDTSTPNRLINLSRSGGGENMDFMMPAGPRNDFRDYFDFINNPPPSVSITDACYPVQAVPSCNVAGENPYTPPMRCGSAPPAGTCSKPETMSVSIATSGKPTATGTLYKAAVFQYSDGNDLSGRTLNGSVSIGSDVRNNILSCSISSGCCTTSSSFTDSEDYSFTTQMHASINADNDIETTISMTCTPPPPVNGQCGNANGNTYDWEHFTNAGPTGSDRCLQGGDNDMNWTGNAAEGGTYTWFCAGLYSGQSSATCSATISPEESPPECGTARSSDNYFSPYRNNGTTYSGTPPTGTEACGNGTQENLTFYNQNWSWRWDCVNNSGASTSCEVLSPCYETGYDPSFMGDCQLPEPVDPGTWNNIDNFGCSDDNERGTNDCPRMEEDIAEAGYDTLDSCPGYSDPDGDSCWNYGEKCMYDYEAGYGAGGDAFVDVTHVEIFECQ